MALTLTIATVDKTDIVEKETLLVEDLLTNQVNTCTFAMIDAAGTNKPSAGQEVVVTIDSVVVFGGYITDVVQTQLAPGEYRYDVNCVDYSDLLRRSLVVEVYQSQPCLEIITDILTDYVAGVTYTHVAAGPTINYISFNYKFPFDCVQELADLTGYDWYVDSAKDLHFFSIETNAAPYSLTDSASTGQYAGLEITVDKTQLRNRVTARGGYELSALYENDVQTAIAGQTVFALKYKPYAPVSIYIDTVAHTLGVDNIDESGKDFVLNQTEKLVKCLDHAALSAGAVVKVAYKYQIPVFAQGDDSDSIDAIKAIEGGTGIYEGEPIIDETIKTKAAARARVKAELEMYSNNLVTGTFVTTQAGYRSGQILTVNIPTRAVNAQYLIQSVSMASVAPGLVEYEVTFASRLKGLTEFLLALFDRGKKIFERADEILDVYKVVQENVTITGAVPTHSTRTPSTSPWKWSNDEETTVGRGRWDLIVWE